MSQTPPPVIDSAKLLYYASTGGDVQFTDRIELHVGDVEDGMARLGQVANLAICSNYTVPGDVLLLFCDEEWAVKGVIATTTIEGAKLQAERGYIGISAKWVPSPYSDTDVDGYLRTEYGVDPSAEWWKMTCSFCGKDHTETDSIVVGPRASICRSCATGVWEILQDERNDR